ncbi:GNAT family N-acetyltransferase [Chitinophaga qingshengii]|uniref:GNAT family N-acetyltransferase n=1 Tax=Chitinophaga qingshengii TaxID=1569794 RepID=A0ABR7TH13_9BACT|nr:GNAT family protein [Chitinophaga qingshengii]MBC9929791.1 GNAT family N-acetyltransferase [Chitinophaga qingshengii]
MQLNIRTERLLLRDFLESDQPALHRLYMLPETIRYNPSGYPKNEDATRQLVHGWAKQVTAPRREDYTAAIIHQQDNTFLGIISLDLGPEKYRKGEVWYKLLPSCWGKGFATEALKGIMSFGFRQLQLHRIESGCSIHNTGSWKVMEKAGMTREGVKRRVLPLEDGWHDAYVYGILENEYQ